MSAWTSGLISFFIICPLFFYLIVFIISKLITKNHRFSVHIALDLSTIFFIISVHFLIQSIWNVSLLAYIIIMMLIIAMVFVIVYWRVNQEITYKKVVRGIWRIQFLLFFCLHVLLMTYGLIFFIIKTVSHISFVKQTFFLS